MPPPGCWTLLIDNIGFQQYAPQMTKGHELLESRLSELGLSAGELARRCGSNPGNISHIRNGRRKPGRSLANCFKRELGIEPESWDEPAEQVAS